MDGKEMREPKRLGGKALERDEIAERPDPVASAGEAVARALAYPTEFSHDRLDFLNDASEWRRLFAELLGTFFLVLVAAGADMVNAKFGGHAIGQAAVVTAPGLMVGAIILFMGSVSGAHLNPAVSLAFAMRGDFPWKRVPGYVVAQFAGACLATLLLVALIGAQGTTGLTLPGPSISPTTVMLWEAVLTVGLVSVILGTASGAQNVGPLSAPAVAGYIALAGAIIAVGIAHLLRGRGGGFYGKMAAQGGLGWLWSAGPITRRVPTSPEDLARKSSA